MRILIIHNRYQQRGGEDSVFENESSLLKKYGNSVEQLIFSNEEINSPISKIKAGISSIYNKSSAKKLDNKIQIFKPDIIHVHNFFPIASPSIFYESQKHNIPIVMTLHNYRLICPNALLFRDGKVCEECINKEFAINGVMNGCYRDSKLQTFALATMSYLHKKTKTWENRVDKYIALTNFAKNKILNSSLKLKEKQITIKPNYVNDHGFELNKDDYLIFIGRLSKEKGVDILLNAFKNSKRKIVIIGSGPMKDIVEEYSKNYQNIEYLGFQQMDVIIQKLKKAKALIFTSVWYEGMPMTILESLSTGTPVVSTDIGGPAEIITNNKTGLIYKVGDVEDLQNSIEKLYSDNDFFKNLCINARKEFEDKFSEKQNYQKLINIYKEVIDEKKSN